MAENLIVTARFTNELRPADIENYFSVYTNVYGTNDFLKQNFRKKYIENIYGPSLILFGFMNNKCVAIQAFLRNDLDGKLAYQSGDSATMDICRGKGVFTTLVKKGLELLPTDAIIYGFPNENSLPIFQKMGWTIGQNRKSGFLFGRNGLDSVEVMDVDYLKWLAKGTENLWYCQRGNHLLILKQKKRNVYQTLGKISKCEIASIKDMAKKAVLPILFVHKDTGKFGKGVTPIALEAKNLDLIKLYKLDVLIAG